MLAEAMEALAFKVRLTGATCPAEFDARVDFLESEARENWVDVGRSEAESVGYAFGHDA